MRNRVRWIVCCVVLVCVGATVFGCAPFQIRDHDEFTPPPAQVSTQADCGSPGVAQRLYDAANSGTPLATREGSIPKGFEPVTVIRCERSGDGKNTRTVDAVTLDGDIDAVSDAFRIKSQRPFDSGTIDCLEYAAKPVALWMVAADGSAIRPTWPSVLCGERDEPLIALKRLREVKRTTVGALEFVPQPKDCAASPRQRFVTTTESAAAKNVPFAVNDSDLRLPTDDVRALTFCHYRIVNETATLVGQRTLSTADSRRVVTAAFSGSRALACNQTATEVVTARLFRADGSGGGQLLVEAVGCHRATVSAGSRYHAMPDDALALLRS